MTATWAWSGAFRIHEILSKEKDTFDPTSTLLCKDVAYSNIVINGQNHKCIKVHLKNPKEGGLGAGINMDLFPATGDSSWMCPVSAYEKWKADSAVKPSLNLPMFRLRGGSSYTGREFNSDLNRLLEKEAGKLNGTITSHSFRQGLATAMAQAGQNFLLVCGGI